MNYPIIFSKFETDFTTYGVAVLENASNIKIKSVVNGEFKLSFILPRNDPKWAYVLEEYFVLVDTQLFRIRAFDEVRDSSGKLLSNVQCEHVWYDANDCSFIPDFEMIGATPTAILTAAFTGTRFTLGTVDASLANTDIFLSKTNPAAIVNKLIENVGGELERDNYTIGLRVKIGNNNSIEFRTGKNNAEIKKTTDSKGLCTRLYPYGVEDLDITSVNATAYLDSQYINNYDYNHARSMDFSDIDDPAELMTKAQAEFSTTEKDGIDKPKVTYEVSVVELKKLARTFEAFALGDTIRIIDEDLNIDVNARIMEYEYYPYEPNRSAVTLANFKNNLGKFLASLADTRNKLNSLTTPQGKVKVAWLENIVEKLQTEINTGLTKKVVSHDYGDMWVDDLESPTKAMAIVNGMFAIANSKKESGDWNWRTFGNGDGFTADLINAGVIRLAETLYVENSDGTVTLNTDGLKVVSGNARAAFLKNAISLQVKVNEVWVDMVYFDTVTGKYKFNGTLEAADGIFSGALQAATGTFSGSVTIGNEGQKTLIDQYGLDTRFVKWFKNMCYNSSFEVFDPDTKLPAYWDGGVSSPDSNFFGDHSLKLEPAESSKQTAAINPQWYNSVSAKTRVSFHKKGGAVKVSVLAADGTPFTLTDEVGATGAYIEYAANTNWLPESYTVSFTHSTGTSIRVKFENSGSADAYIDGVIVEPDYTGKRPSFYSDGPNSIGTTAGKEIITVVETTETAVQAIRAGVQVWNEPGWTGAEKRKRYAHRQ